MSPQLIIGIVVAIAVVTLMVIVSLIAKRYQKVSPNEVLIIAGRRHTIETKDGPKIVGYRIVKGGGTFVWPILEKVAHLSLNAISLEVSTTDAYTKNGVPVTVDSIVIMKIGGDDVSISNAAERFLELEQEDIKSIAQEVLSGHLRAICSTLTPEEINKERQQFQQNVLVVSHEDFSAMGLYIDSFTVKQISDAHGYLEALGKASTANVKRDAIIGEANALDKEAVQQKTDAQKEGAVRKAENEAMIASADKDRDVKMATYSADVAKEKAKAAQAGPKATAEATQEVVQAQTDLAMKEAIRAEKQLITTQIKPAEATKTTTIINAEALKQQIIIQAEATRQQQITEAEGEKQKMILEGDGQAAKTTAIGIADGTAVSARGRGEAEAIEAKLIAQAAGTKAQLLAEADGLGKKAEAMAQFNDASMVLQQSLELIRILPDLVRAAASPITAIKDLKIIDFGGGNGSGGNSNSGPIDKLLQISPQTLAATNETLKQTLGIDLMDFIDAIRTGKSGDILKGIKSSVPEKGK